MVVGGRTNRGTAFPGRKGATELSSYELRCRGIAVSRYLPYPPYHPAAGARYVHSHIRTCPGARKPRCTSTPPHQNCHYQALALQGRGFGCLGDFTSTAYCILYKDSKIQDYPVKTCQPSLSSCMAIDRLWRALLTVAGGILDADLVCLSVLEDTATLELSLDSPPFRHCEVATRASQAQTLHSLAPSYLADLYHFTHGLENASGTREDLMVARCPSPMSPKGGLVRSNAATKPSRSVAPVPLSPGDTMYLSRYLGT